MKDVKDESNENLVSILLGWSGQLNGTAESVLMDGGARARKTIQSSLNEIIERWKLDSSIGNAPPATSCDCSFRGRE